MALTRWQSTIVDERGNVQPGAVLTIRNEADQSLAQVFESPSDQQPYPPGTVTADQSGYAYFYAKGGLYRIQSAELGIDWRHVPIGNAQAADVVQETGESEDAVMSQKAATEAFAQLSGGMNADFDAMPMVSGSPIIERGSNANGEYVRFADGTQICMSRVTMSSQALSQDNQVEWQFPLVFSTTPYVVVTPETSIGSGSQTSVGALVYNGIYLAVRETNVRINSYSYRTAVDAPTLLMGTAHGRWK